MYSIKRALACLVVFTVIVLQPISLVYAGSWTIRFLETFTGSGNLHNKAEWERMINGLWYKPVPLQSWNGKTIGNFTLANHIYFTCESGGANSTLCFPINFTKNVTQYEFQSVGIEFFITQVNSSNAGNHLLVAEAANEVTNSEGDTFTRMGAGLTGLGGGATIEGAFQITGLDKNNPSGAPLVTRFVRFPLNEPIRTDGSVRYAVTFEKLPFGVSGMSLVASVYKVVGGQYTLLGSRQEDYTNEEFQEFPSSNPRTGTIPDTTAPTSESLIGLVFDRDVTIKIDDFYLSQWVN